ncbi:MAG: hypothetical protein A3G34_12085 [Candidatus Lindowbacteria bacterium RIFCSPLOWO2_12_FULL_62_27]|nr:MAG: hypothetical protein A3G34_12085 [Candidatus Lindowbacteria bacterium RIFCSPLOWO2_12_FULL_62_27]OGH61076.1 MAG: hypothetical protein A3I06_16235 [Candidatus Lindowbacteria bacterium RIFCSPLOWO2_02_FULL_62_12]
MAEYLLRRRNRTAWFRGFFQTISMYQFEDHVAVLRTTGYTMTVKRFFFKDIVSLVAVRSRFYLVEPCVWGGVFLIGVFTSPWALGAGALGLAWEFWRGPRATFEIRTANSAEKISHVSRLRRVRKILDALAAAVLQAQGAWPDPMPAHEPFAPVSFAGFSPSPRSRAAGARGAAPPKPADVWLYATLWMMAVPNLVIMSAGFFFPKIFVVSPVVFCLSLAGMIFVMFRLRQLPESTPWTKAAGWYGCLSAAAAMAALIFFYYKGVLKESLQAAKPWISELDVLIRMSRDPAYAGVMHPLSGNLALAVLLCGAAVARAISRRDPDAPDAPNQPQERA